MYEGKLLRDKLISGHVCLGIFNSSSDPCIAELLCGSGLDFMIIDAEHGALIIETVQANIMAAKGSDTVPLVRVPSQDDVFIKRVLDAGAGGILVPQVRSVEEVQRAVSACLYPPEGVRGVGPRRAFNYYRDLAKCISTANECVVVLAQIENADAISAIEQICKVSRLDGVIPGPSDLSTSMGFPGQPQHPEVLAAIERMKIAAKNAGIAPGMAGSVNAETSIDWLAKGYQFVTVGNNISLIANACDALVDCVRKSTGKAKGGLS